MSLIMSVMVPEGMIVASDKRSTHQEDGKISYTDSTNKSIILNNEIIVSHCGNNFINKDTTVETFLEKFKHDNKFTSIFDVSPLLMDAYLEYGVNADVTFMVSGIEKYRNSELVYNVNTKNRSVTVQLKNNEYAAAFSGETAICNVLMNGITYSKLGLDDAITLVQSTMRSVGENCLFRKEQCIGIIFDIFVLDKRTSHPKWTHLQ